MAYTFEACWRKVLLHAPAVPPHLAREFVQQAFARACELRPWGHLRKEAHLQTLAARSLEVTFTTGSAAITSAAEFVATDVGRQLKVDSLPIYTINTVVDASTATLLETYKGDSGAATATIVDAYLVCPADFGRFHTIVNPSNQRRVPFWFSEEALNEVDPHRTSSGDPARVLVSTGYSQVTSLAGRALYEWWPQPTSARVYPALYFTRPPTLADTDTLPGVLAQRGDVLVTGALAECAQWPGTGDRPNPYFNLNLHRLKSEQFMRDVLSLALRDDDVYPMDLPQIDWAAAGAWELAFDTNLLRSTDATVADYY
jgi:hypothetical protein